MQALWRRGPLMVADILAEVAEAQKWSDATVKSLIGRLLKKRAIQSSRVDGRVFYRPLVARDDYIRSESQGFLDRLFGGQLAPFVSHFTQHQDLSPEDRARLLDLLTKLDHGE